MLVNAFVILFSTKAPLHVAAPIDEQWARLEVSKELVNAQSVLLVALPPSHGGAFCCSDDRFIRDRLLVERLLLLLVARPLLILP